LPEIRKAIDEGEPFLGIVRNYRKNGELFWNELSISPVRDHNGHLAHFIGIQKDVTAQVFLVERLEQAIEEKEQARDMMLKVLKLVSHDAKNLLASIRWNAEHCRAKNEQLFTVSQLNDIDHVLQAVETLTDLFKKILDKECNIGIREKPGQQFNSNEYFSELTNTFRRLQHHEKY